MAELLFIATTIFVAYVVFEVVGKNKDKPDAAKAPAKPVVVAKPIAATEKTPAPAPAPVAAKPVAKKAVGKSKAAPAKVVAPTTVSDGLKNPKTGELAKLPGNYAFAKRWIKDALVEEGLLDKVYKNNELDTETAAKIQKALQQLQAMEKYQ